VSAPISVGSGSLLGGRRMVIVVALAIAALLALALVLALAASSTGPARAAIEVVSLPPGAEVRLDENRLPRVTPIEISDVDPQVEHHVRVSMRGYDVWESDVKFEHGARRVRLQAVLVPAVGSVEIASTPPGAEAIVNGTVRGKTPLTVGDLPPNDDVTIDLLLRGYRMAHRSLPWQGQRKLVISIPLEKSR
jgi:hypothetical protein